MATAVSKHSTSEPDGHKPPLELSKWIGAVLAENARLAAASSSDKACPVGVDEHEAAKIIGMSVYFLRKDRRTKRLIPFYRIGDAIRYNPGRMVEALRAFEEGGVAAKTRARAGRKP